MDTALNYITNYELDREELDYITAKIIGKLYLATITMFNSVYSNEVVVMCELVNSYCGVNLVE